MRNWQDCTLGDVLTLQRGFDLPVQNRKAGPFPVIAATGQVGTHRDAMVEGPGVVIGRSGSIGGGQYIIENFWPLNTTLWVKDFKGNNRRYCYYLLKTIDFLGWNVGSGVPTLNRNHVHPLPVRLPDRVEQDRIVAILGSLDDKIELNRRMNETLEQMGQAIFRDWFVNFGPVRRKLEGATDPVKIMGGLVQDKDEAARLAALFPSRLTDDGLPEGWEERTVEDVLTLSYGKALKATNRVDGPYPVYGSGGITGFHKEPLVKGPSVIVGRKGTVGSLYWEDRDFFPIDTVFYVEPKSSLTHCYYLLQTLGLSGMNTDAAVPGLNRNNAYRLPANWPGDEIVSEFDKFARLLRKKIAQSDAESEALTEIRDFLLPQLMSGRVTLKDAEGAV